MTRPDNTRSRVDVSALMAPRLRVDGDPSCKKVMEFLIVTQLEPVRIRLNTFYPSLLQCFQGANHKYQKYKIKSLVINDSEEHQTS